MSKTVRSYRIDPEDDALVQAAARRQDLAPSAFVRQAAVKRAIRELTKDREDPDASQPRQEEAA